MIRTSGRYNLLGSFYYRIFFLHHGVDCVVSFSFFKKVQDVGAEKDAITFLHAPTPTHYGKANWDRLFPSIVEKHWHPETDIGILNPVLFSLLG